jgi:hypothetical protein
MKVNNFLNLRGKELICKMEVEFDSHRFITQFINDYEREYVELLYGYLESVGIFQTLHAQIGRYLSDNAVLLSIEKLNKDYSENIKGYDSKNQIWKRIL